MMILLAIVFLLLICYEWQFLKKRNRKKRTFTIVFIVMGLSSLYAAGQILFPYLLTPNTLLEAVFAPITRMLMINGG